MNVPQPLQTCAEFNALTTACRSSVAVRGAEGEKTIRHGARAQGGYSPGRRARQRNGPAETFGPGPGAGRAVAQNYFPQ